jgi:DNA-binding NtrC family response regulator
LRALESSEIRPLGSDRVVQTDVRIVAATHRDLATQIRTGRFREDLYYRLNVCRLRPPSLNERSEDFTDLAYAFAKIFRVRFSVKALEKLKSHDWPGNIRELKNVVARTSAYFPGKHIQPEDLDAVLDMDSSRNRPRHIEPDVETLIARGSGDGEPILKALEREIIIRRLAANGGNQRRTAQDLGMPKSTLHDRLKTYAIDPSSVDKGTIS